ncbi:GNAT family N-acetyltransferase [Rhizobium sp. NPDC090279]|uniref:GNAT family N-acetyltransferase n=1 Tax=Rhizobium sp. NPDC090279 TaxID=3364499 RepID=UPI00383BA916
MQIQIDLAAHTDIAPWLMLADEVVELFGPMPGFSAILERKIDQKRALCARIAGGQSFAGGILLGGSGDVFWIRWLAVSREHRRHGIGRRLIEAAIARSPPHCFIYVDTFTEETVEGLEARRAYESCGFTPAEIWESDDMVRQRFIRAC